MKQLSIILILLAGLTSCWPKSFMNPIDNSMPEEWKKFYITPLELTATTAPSNYPANLAEELRSGVQNNTRLRLASNLEDSQIKISGIISGYNTTPIAIQQGDLAAKNRLTVSVNFTILTPTKGLEKMEFTSSRFADYESSEQLVDVETRLLESINQQVVQDVVNKLLSNW
ncbi:LPS assembly lipoprotein LptE [Fluviicola taffensis]|uniref:LPS assembly lipoprotein LptE n=2 Tax=Fluviicola TaxID=332102 RepID=UPI003137F9AC